MLWIALVLIVLALFFGPQLWAQSMFRRYAKERDDIPGSGGELARHLLGLFKLEGEVGVEKLSDTAALGEGSAGDHYDPIERKVRLAAANYNGRSLTAIAVAAHEVGHALQHAANEPLFRWRIRLVVLAQWAQRAGAALMVAMPFVALVTRVPQSGGVVFAIGLISLGLAAVVHLVTLPVEWDASFGKALPLLEKGNFVADKDRPAVRRILRAAALTYLASSLASLLNVWRWLRLLRGR